MNRFAIIAILALCAILMHAQGVTQDEVTGIRAAYWAAKEQVKLNEEAQEQNVPRSDMEVVSHYVIPGCGPTEEVIHYYFKLEEDPEQETTFQIPYFITRRYNVAARKFYQEFLFSGSEAELLFFFQSNDAMDGGTDETRYYYGSQGVHQVINGNAEMDETFAARLADELKTAFNALMNREF